MLQNQQFSPIILAGTGRSGTSWLLDILTLHQDYRPILEPLNWEQMPSVENLHNLYLTAQDEHPELRKFMNEVFYGRPREGWARWMHFGISKDTPLLRTILQYGYNLPKYKFWARQRVVKMIRGNLMLDWLMNQFDIRLLYMIRHPCAVIASQRKMGWDTNLDHLLQQPTLVERYLKDKIELIDSATTELERLTILWCIGNLIPLQQINNNMFKSVNCLYEDIVCKPVDSLHGMLSGIGLSDNLIRKFVEKMKKNKPPRKEILEKWKRDLSNNEIDYILDTAHSFGIDIYDSQPYPDKYTGKFRKVFSTDIQI